MYGCAVSSSNVDTIDVAKEDYEDGTIPVEFTLSTSHPSGKFGSHFWMRKTDEISGKRRTHVALAATISCLLAFVKAERSAEKTSVKSNISTIVSGFLEIVPWTENR